MSGTRLALTALSELRRRGGGVAAVALCGGGGQGDAAILSLALIGNETRDDVVTLETDRPILGQGEHEGAAEGIVTIA